MTEQIDNQLLLLLGEIKGQLKAVQDQITASSESTNKRIDDLSQAVDRRIDDHQRSNETRFTNLQGQITSVGDRVKTVETNNKPFNKKGLVVSTGSAAIIVALIETTKTLISQ